MPDLPAVKLISATALTTANKSGAIAINVESDRFKMCIRVRSSVHRVEMSEMNIADDGHQWGRRVLSGSCDDETT
jgi:hypothetical protein